jgi:magnesium chelatase family protein
LDSLSADECRAVERRFDWAAHWEAPALPEFSLPQAAAEALGVAVHAGLNVLVAGPQGSGKTTWAKMLYALSAPPDVPKMFERADLFQEDELALRWRPLEQPHHSITPQAMVGGCAPVRPGVISRAHGGVLIMDEFLQFPSTVLESLREPMETGWIEIARRGERHRLRADFQLIATTNLCPCGKLAPELEELICRRGVHYCRSVCSRLSGPILDRFDLLVFSEGWLAQDVPRMSLLEVAEQVRRAREFSSERSGLWPLKLPENLQRLPVSHRRKQSMLRVARGLADLALSERPRPSHFERAEVLTMNPMDRLARLFA